MSEKKNIVTPIISILDYQIEQLADHLSKGKKENNAYRMRMKSSSGENESNFNSFDLKATQRRHQVGFHLDKKRSASVPKTRKFQESALNDQGDERSLDVWLCELDLLQKDLNDSIISPSRHTRDGNSSSRRMSTPRVGSPRLDSYRYSLMNLQETQETDLDAILGELCILESNGLYHNPRSSHCNLPPQRGTCKQTVEPQYISAETVRRQKQQNFVSLGTDSPDNDSAFGDSSNSSGNSDLVPTHCRRLTKSAMPFDEIDLPAAEAKALKIRLAIEKMKEASIKKIFIKVFGDDGSAKSLLVDERMTVAYVCQMIAEKNCMKRDTGWGLVELLPDMHMERAYEDNEFLVENLLMWKAESKNTLWFIRRPEIYHLFYRPEMYLLGYTSSQCGSEMDDYARAELIEEFFSSTGVGAPEIEGFLWLKSENRKNWKKFYFVLRTSGLYYAPKGKKTSKDLICLARIDVNHVYYGVKWQAKFKSLTKHCFAIKHPQIQTKNAKHIRYLCTETETDLNRWVTGIRIAKYGRQLYTNYRCIIEEMAHEDLDQIAYRRYSSSTPDSGNENKIMEDTITAILQPSSSSHLSYPCSSINSGKSSGLSISMEHGFNCDSPEGGTIRKKPPTNLLHTFKSSNKVCESSRLPTATIRHSSVVLPFKLASVDDDVMRLPTKPIGLGNSQRHSLESLISNPSMLHSAKVTPISLNSETDYYINDNDMKFPQPKRPAPILNNYEVINPYNDGSFSPTVHKPTYEETLKKCEMLTPMDQMHHKSKLTQKGKITHLPPSGRSQSVNRSSTHCGVPQGISIEPDIHRSSDDEHDNQEHLILRSQAAMLGALKCGSGGKIIPPPLPKRYQEDNYFNWKRS